MWRSVHGERQGEGALYRSAADWLSGLAHHAHAEDLRGTG
ncbi:hypothetical protein UYSO10_5940 [Kosakonia radicincitans]|nr:hypothetical protein UYSO10_5940 [Kosakonia radicincitans]